MPLEVPLRAEAGGAFDAVQNEVQVARELAGMVAERAQAQMQGVSASSLEHLRELDAFFKRGHHGVVADVGVVRLDAVHENLHDEVVPAGRLDLLHQLHHVAGTVLQRLRAIIVFAHVLDARQERLADIEAGGIDLERLEPIPLDGLAYVDDAVLERMDLFDRHFVCALRRERIVLVAEVRAVLLAVLHQLFRELGRLRRVLSRHGGQLVHHFEPDHLYAALGEVHVVVVQFLREPREVAGRPGSRLHHTVAELYAAKLPRREQRAEIRGVLPVLVVLRIERGGSDQPVVGTKGRPCTRRPLGFARAAAACGRTPHQPCSCGGNARHSHACKELPS